MVAVRVCKVQVAPLHSGRIDRSGHVTSPLLFYRGQVNEIAAAVGLAVFIISLQGQGKI
jgi:hypothetical protein